MSLPATLRLYLDDAQGPEARATVLAVEGQEIACDRTVFFPGGGGQPCDTGEVRFADGVRRTVTAARADAGGVIWLALEGAPDPSWVGQAADLAVDAARRALITRHHTLLHVINTVAWRDHAAWITGAQIGTEYSRIDFKIEGFGPELVAAMEARVNAVLAEDRPVRSREVDEAEYRARDDLRRTLDVSPPVRDGRVRIVEIEGFDAQACGGTHVRRTGEIGRCEVFRTENKGRINKRLYVRLA